MDKLIQTFRPSEVLLQKNMQAHFRALFGEKFYINTFDDWVFTLDFTQDLLQKHFGTTSLKGFGVDDLPRASLPQARYCITLPRRSTTVCSISARYHDWKRIVMSGLISSPFATWNL